MLRQLLRNILTMETISGPLHSWRQRGYCLPCPPPPPQRRQSDMLAKVPNHPSLSGDMPGDVLGLRGIRRDKLVILRREGTCRRLSSAVPASERTCPGPPEIRDDMLQAGPPSRRQRRHAKGCCIGLPGVRGDVLETVPALPVSDRACWGRSSTTGTSTSYMQCFHKWALTKPHSNPFNHVNDGFNILTWRSPWRNHAVLTSPYSPHAAPPKKKLIWRTITDASRLRITIIISKVRKDNHITNTKGSYPYSVCF